MECALMFFDGRIFLRKTGVRFPGKMLLPQLQRGEPCEREHDRDDPETDHDLRLGPALLLEVMMQWRHLEHALAGELEGDHLHDHRYRFEHEQTADDAEHDLV